MKKIILASLVIELLVLTATGTCFTAGAVMLHSQSTQFQTTETAGTGIIKGTITNQNGKPIGFVRVIAAGSPSDNATKLAFTVTHLLPDGKGEYSLEVPAGRYLFVHAAKLPLYLGAWAGPVTVNEGESITLDLSITYIGPKNAPVVVPKLMNFGNGKLFNFLYSTIFQLLK